MDNIEHARTDHISKQELDTLINDLYAQCGALQEYFYTNKRDDYYEYTKFVFPTNKKDVQKVVGTSSANKLIIQLAIAEAEMKKHLATFPRKFKQYFKPPDTDDGTEKPAYLNGETAEDEPLLEQLRNVALIKSFFSGLTFQGHTIQNMMDFLTLEKNRWDAALKSCNKSYTEAESKLGSYIEAYEKAQLHFLYKKSANLFCTVTKTVADKGALDDLTESLCGVCILVRSDNKLYCNVVEPTKWVEIGDIRTDSIYIQCDEKEIYKMYCDDEGDLKPVPITEYRTSTILYDEESARHYTLLKYIEEGFFFSTTSQPKPQFSQLLEYENTPHDERCGYTANVTRAREVFELGEDVRLRKLIKYVYNVVVLTWPPQMEKVFKDCPLHCTSTNIQGGEVTSNPHITFERTENNELVVVLKSATIAHSSPVKLTICDTKSQMGKVSTPELLLLTENDEIHLKNIHLQNIQGGISYSRCKSTNKDSQKYVLKFRFENNTLESYVFYLVLAQGGHDNQLEYGGQHKFTQGGGRRRTPTRRAPHSGLVRSTRRRQKRVNVRKRRNHSGTHKKAINRGHGKVFTRRRI